MSVVVTGYDQGAVRVGVFCRPDGFNASSLGWPIGRFTFGAIGCSLTPFSPSSQQRRRTFAWADVVGAETTRFGVRFRFDDPNQTVAIATLRPAERVRLLEAARTYCPAGTVADQVDPRNPDDGTEHTGRRASVWMRAVHVRRSLMGKTSKTQRRQPEQT